MRLRVSWRGYWQADCETSDEVAGYVDISTLVPSVTHLYQRAYPVTPWKKAADLLDAEMGRALEATVPATAGGLLPAPGPRVRPPTVIG